MKRIFQRWASLLQRFINVDRDQRCWSAMQNRWITVIVDNADQRSSNGFSKNFNHCHRFSTMIIVQRSSTMLQQRSLFPVNASSTLRQRLWPEPIINVDRCIDQIKVVKYVLLKSTAKSTLRTFWQKLTYFYQLIYQSIKFQVYNACSCRLILYDVLFRKSTRTFSRI